MNNSADKRSLPSGTSRERGMDESLWHPLVTHGVTIYSHELVLGAAFTQFVGWNGEDKILARRDRNSNYCT